jgi:hypothetical protein
MYSTLTPSSSLQLLEQVDNRHAQRGIHHRDRFVSDDQRRIGQQGARNRDALQLPAGKFAEGYLPANSS